MHLVNFRNDCTNFLVDHYSHMFSAVNAFHAEPSAIQAFIIIIIILGSDLLNMAVFLTFLTCSFQLREPLFRPLTVFH